MVNMKYIRNWKYYLYQVYAELASRYYAIKARNNPIPSINPGALSCGDGVGMDRL